MKVINTSDYNGSNLTGHNQNNIFYPSMNIYNYNGFNITFQKGNGEVMINLTEISKAFPKKNLTTIINSNEIQEYIEKLSKLKNYSLADLLNVIRGGNNPGTWAHQKVALRVAQKLSPDFAIWVDTKIEELLISGVTTVNNDDETIANALLILQKRLEANQQKTQILEQQNEIQQSQIKLLEPKAKYTDEVLQSTSTFTTTQIAQDMDMSAVKLNRRLKDLGVQYFQSGQWLLSYKYQGKGYVDMRVSKYFKNGEPATSQTMVWTERGRLFILSLRNKGKL